MNDETVIEQYNNNEQVRAYINAYAIHRSITVKEAFKHLIVKEYVKWVMNNK